MISDDRGKRPVAVPKMYAGYFDRRGSIDFLFFTQITAMFINDEVWDQGVELWKITGRNTFP